MGLSVYDVSGLDYLDPNGLQKLGGVNVMESQSWKGSRDGPCQPVQCSNEVSEGLECSDGIRTT